MINLYNAKLFQAGYLIRALFGSQRFCRRKLI